MIQTKVGTTWWIVIIGVIVLGGVGLFFYFNNQKEELPEDKPDAPIIVSEKDLQTYAQTTHQTYTDTLLAYVLDEHVEISEEEVATRVTEFKGFMRENNLEGLTDNEIEQAMRTQVAKENAILKTMNLTRKDIREEYERGKGIHEVVHAVIVSVPEGQTKESLIQDLTQDLKTIKEDLSVATLMEKYGEHVDFLIDLFGDHNLVPGFESIREKEAGTVEQFGDEEFTSLMYVIKVNKELVEDDYTDIYLTYGAGQFGTAVDFLDFYLSLLDKQLDVQIAEAFLEEQPPSYATYLARAEKLREEKQANEDTNLVEGGTTDDK